MKLLTSIYTNDEWDRMSCTIANVIWSLLVLLNTPYFVFDFEFIEFAEREGKDISKEYLISEFENKLEFRDYSIDGAYIVKIFTNQEIEGFPEPPELDDLLWLIRIT